ncbi:hypothetical protein [Flavobacterium sp. Root420]|uniref:hypothetical protein n=1 Tax=Flavobacterium sp. Root420 TaxID=1736533 RepID=UPI000A615BDA|nr:hypothetical protein [Flavobacterium sp. Root420]
MKKIILICLLMVNGIVFSQNNEINKALIIPESIDFKGCVKKIAIKALTLNRVNTKIDSIRTTSEVSFSKKGKVQLLKLYDKSTMDSWRVIEFDALERIKNIWRNTATSNLVFVNQYFSGNSEFPDSTKINRDENYKEKYINRFTKNIVTKQEHYINDTLQDFRVYKYDMQNQMIEDLYHNVENDSGETLVTSESNDGYKLSFYPERQTLYEHKKDKDTTIVVKISPRYSMKEVTKKIKNKNFDLKIVEEYDRGYLKKSSSTWTSKDSLSLNINIYVGQKEIDSYYKTFKNSKQVTYKSKSNFFKQGEEIITVVNVDTVFDKFSNWVKKIYTSEGVIQSIIERKIDYYCH